MNYKTIFAFGILLVAFLAVVKASKSLSQTKNFIIQTWQSCSSLSKIVCVSTPLSGLKLSNFCPVILDEYNDSPEMFSDDQYDEAVEAKRKTLSDETTKAVVEDMNTETSALVQNDYSDPDAVKNKGCKYDEKPRFR